MNVGKNAQILAQYRRVRKNDASEGPPTEFSVPLNRSDVSYVSSYRL